MEAAKMAKTLGGITGVLFLVTVLVLVVVGVPLAVIWAVNTLFALGIAYTFWTWLATLILMLTVFSSKISK